MVLTLRREESFESGQHALSDEFVNVVEAAGSLGDTRNISAEMYSELHPVVKFKFMLEGDRGTDYVPRLRNINFEDGLFLSRGQVGEMQDGSTAVRGNPSMLVEV